PPAGHRTAARARRVLLDHRSRAVEDGLPSRAPAPQSVGDLSPHPAPDRALAARPADLRHVLPRPVPAPVAPPCARDRADAGHGRSPPRPVRRATGPHHRDPPRLPPEPGWDAAPPPAGLQRGAVAALLARAGVPAQEPRGTGAALSRARAPRRLRSDPLLHHGGRADGSARATDTRRGPAVRVHGDEPRAARER